MVVKKYWEGDKGSSPDELLLCDSFVRIVVQLAKKDLSPLCRLHLVFEKKIKRERVY